MSERTQHDRDWLGWCQRFDDAYSNVQMMFHHRHIWKNLAAMLERNLGDAAVVESWLKRMYVDSQCSAIRRLNDDNPATASLRRCLRKLIKTPTMVTRARFEKLATAHAATRNDLADEVIYGRAFGYAAFADASGDHLHIPGVADDL
jgi:hypothetical protein